MWTLKNKSFKRLTQEETTQQGLPAGRVFDMQMTFTVTDGTNDIEVVTFVDSEDTAVRTMRDKLEKMNKQEAFMAEANDPDWTLPEPEAKPEPTEVEKKKAIFDRELAEYKEMVELSQTLDNLVDSNDLTNKANAVRNARTEYENARRNA